MARRLAIGGRILVDEFTSVLDRRLAALLCRSVARHVRHTRRQLVVATIHLDVVRYLQPDWLFRSDSAELCTFTGALSCARTFQGLFRLMFRLLWGVIEGSRGRNEVPSHPKCRAWTTFGHPRGASPSRT